MQERFATSIVCISRFANKGYSEQLKAAYYSLY